MIAEEITSESFQLKWKIPRTTDEGTEIPMMFTVRTKDESGRVVKEKEKMREQECLIDGLRGSTKYSVVVISTPVFSSITDPSSSTSISEVLEVITNPEKNRLDATCAGRKLQDLNRWIES